MPRSRQCMFPRTRQRRYALRGIAAALLSIPALAEPPLSPTDVRAWADATFEAGLARHEFSGLVVSVVSGGQMILSKGYGRADFASSGPVDPSATLFRIGSITKTFTASLLAKLVEEGSIRSLDDPANRYLRDYRLPDNDGVAITLHHLVTHTAGFEDRFYFIGADHPASARLPAREFDALRPAYVRPAGTRVEYSNFGIAVVGRIIEDVTGLPIEVAMRNMLLDPLHMAHTRLLVDVNEPAGLGKPATIRPDGSFHPTPYTAINPAVAAAGSLVTTGDDMTRYMLAQLHSSGGARSGQSPVLSEQVLAMLHDRRAGNAPETTGIGMTFFDEPWGAWRTIAHGGNWEGFHSWMTLIPGRDTGIFISVMSEAAAPQPLQAVRDLFAPGSASPPSPAVVSGWAYTQKFLDHFLGERRRLPARSTPFEPSATEGWYRPDRRVFSTAESVADLIYLGAGMLRIDAADGALEVGGAGPWRSAGKGIFILEAPNRNRVVIRDDARVHAPVLIPDPGIYTFTRIPAIQNPRLHAKALVIAIVLSAIAWLVMLARVRRGTRRAPAIAATATALLACALPIIGAAKLYDGRSMLEALYGGDTFPLAVYVIAAQLLAAAAIATLVLAIRASSQSRLSRGCQLLIGLCGIMLIGILAQYNVLGWQLPG